MADLSATREATGADNGEIFVDPAIDLDADRHRGTFQRAEPFRHLVLEPFFVEPIAVQLLADFPPFDDEKAKDEFGRIGRKAVNERLAAISPTYARLAAYLESDRFLRLVSRLTGIPDLRADPTMYGGGTHENQHGQELDPHVDFNYDPATKLHRRLNLLVYLNEEWRPEWGGAIELHSNPRQPDTNRITAHSPDFNRAVLFETNEYSWHGFPKIELPPDKRQLSRKSISIYLYTRDRPAQEIVPEHSTFYVQRPLPERIRPGHVLTAADVVELRSLLTRRDSWIERYQAVELKTSAELGSLNERIRGLEHTMAEAPAASEPGISSPRNGPLIRGLRERLSRLLRRRWPP